MPKVLAPVVFIISTLLTILLTVLCSIPIAAAGIVKLLVPIPVIWRRISAFADAMMWCWCQGLAVLLRLNRQLEWDIEGLAGLERKNWYLLISNHESWSDIVVLCVLFRNRIPMNKYFLKQQLAWVPFVGLACWALDMPFMKRYSRAYLLKHPEKRGKDIETTRRSCEKFRQRPTTIVNFVEGSRFTESKKIKTHSPYRNLLAPKAAGIAFTLSALGNQFDRVLNVTLHYPDNNQRPFLDMLCGRLKRVVVRIDMLPIDETLHGDYFNDKHFKRQFQLWLNALWQEKDRLLDKIKRQYQ
ncbi:acyltransferase [Serratia odorifera]|jgi:1-acyl-sn-glycerol-3-phosphate acyltransferase|uniref:Acyltransferase n=2 Tax=Serratia odorifera TaxID=618 RepID=D4DZF4_SEROD|nr:acyltransferase [Serratia odorifera]EFE97212.1 Acyltransferase [Serratia odorifera DSM 4582]MBJ2067045.1 acyltransferase [Serratia odorifera]PNK91580.1 acyltransferase [Serratia odorifera]RII72834.1 acyltransferase [Serratia odorifera]VDZ55275.1 Probable acyltransferase yihG [Serratia odorifera]